MSVQFHERLPQGPAAEPPCHEKHLASLNPELWAGKTLVIAGGGTGGHVFPGLALVELLRSLLPDPPAVHWIGSANRIEAELVPPRGIEFHPLDITYLRRSLKPAALKQNATVLYRLSTGATFREAERILREVNADLVFSLGSFVGGPVVIAAHHAGIPSVILELNAVVGKATRWSAPVANAICVSTAEAYQALDPRYHGRVYTTGTPIRPSIFEGDKIAASLEFGLDLKQKTILVLGGSQGAAAINAQIPALWEALRCNVLHQAGEKGAASIAAPAGSQGRYVVKPFIGNMANAYALADLVISRAGATTLAELTALGKPAILIPFGQSAEGHQLANARSMGKLGAAICIPESELTTEVLIARTNACLEDAKRLATMSWIARAEGRPGATGDLALVCEGVLATHQRVTR